MFVLVDTDSHQWWDITGQLTLLHSVAEQLPKAIAEVMEQDGIDDFDAALSVVESRDIRGLIEEEALSTVRDLIEYLTNTPGKPGTHVQWLENQ